MLPGPAGLGEDLAVPAGASESVEDPANAVARMPDFGDGVYSDGEGSVSAASCGSRPLGAGRTSGADSSICWV